MSTNSKTNNLINDKWILFDQEGYSGDGRNGEFLESQFGFKRNNKKTPDLGDEELKSQSKETNSKSTLFCLEPLPKGINSVLREKYGKLDEFGKLRSLSTDINALKYNTSYGNYGYKLIVDRELEKIFISIILLNTGDELDRSAYWNFADIKKSLCEKLEKQKYYEHEEKSQDGKLYIKYNLKNDYSGVNFEKFLVMINSGDMIIGFRMYVSEKANKMKNPGTAFRAKKGKVGLMYDDVTTYN